MPLNAGEPGYGALPGAGPPGPAAGDSEATPLLMPDSEPVYRWEPLSKAQLEAAAGGPGWRRARCYLVLVFWLSWMAMLATAISIIVLSPRPSATPLRWWQKSLFYQLQPQLSPGGSGGVQGEQTRVTRDEVASLFTATFSSICHLVFTQSTEGGSDDGGKEG